MGYRSRFYIERVKHGWRDSIEQANAVAALVGGLILLLGAALCAPIQRTLGQLRGSDVAIETGNRRGSGYDPATCAEMKRACDFASP